MMVAAERDWEAMIPSSNLERRILFEQLQREAEQARLRAGPPRHDQWRDPLRRLGSLFAALRTDEQEPTLPAACNGGQNFAAGRDKWAACLAANTGIGA
jgi:hypothetical protein